MSLEIIMDVVVTKIKAVLSEAEEVLAGEVTPERSEEVNRLLKKALSAGWTEGLGTWLATAESDAEIRATEPLPDETRVLCASLDGVNVLLGEPGKKKGRPNERPHEGSSASCSPTCYKNATVGCVRIVRRHSRQSLKPSLSKLNLA